MLLLLLDILMLLLFDFFIFSPSFIYFLIIRVAFVARLLAIRGQKKEELKTKKSKTKTKTREQLFVHIDLRAV